MTSFVAFIRASSLLNDLQTDSWMRLSTRTSLSRSEFAFPGRKTIAVTLRGGTFVARQLHVWRRARQHACPSLAWNGAALSKTWIRGQ